MSGGIGTLGEKSLHRALKSWYQPDETRHEVRLGRFTADAENPQGGVIEVQTGSFFALKKRLPVYLMAGRVLLVCPVVQRKWLCWVDPETGEVLSRRCSPKQGTVLDLSRELVHILPFLREENLVFSFPFLEVEEYRLQDGWSRDKKRGSSRYERKLLQVFQRVDVHTSSQWAALLPDLPQPFTAKELQKAARLSPQGASAAVKVWKTAGALFFCGKKGRSYTYRPIQPGESPISPEKTGTSTVEIEKNGGLYGSETDKPD